MIYTATSILKIIHNRDYKESKDFNKENVINKGLYAKFSQNEELKNFVKSRSNDEEVDSSAEIEEVVEVRKKPKSKSKPKPKKRIVYVSDNEESDHSTDDEIVMKKALKQKKSST